MCPNCGLGQLDFELCPNTSKSPNKLCIWCCPCHSEPIPKAVKKPERSKL